MRYRRLIHRLLIAVCSMMTGCADDSSADSAPEQIVEADRVLNIDDKDSPNSADDSDSTPANNDEFRPIRTFEEGERNAQTNDANDEGEVQPVFRPKDDRPEHDDARLAQIGIHRYESNRLRLYTDIDSEIARKLPPFVDALYEELEAYFGPLPPNRARTPFQMTGYLMADAERFRSAGLLPEDLPEFKHGRHRGAEFWMNDQEFDYYRRHLMLHEATHCFMTILPNTRLPIWYFEGMAEHFGTHRIEDDGTIRFRVMPHDKDAFAGLGRITLIQEAVKAGRAFPLGDVLRMRPEVFVKNEAYAWAWTVCHFLGTHPRYRERFRELGEVKTMSRFDRTFRELFEADAREMSTEWIEFIHTIDDGYDLERAAIAFRSGAPIAGDGPQIIVQANRGWQSSGFRVEAGKSYRLTAKGRFTLAQTSKPWISEANGISFWYFDGRPIGLLLGTIHEENADKPSPWKPFPLGTEATFTAEQTGTLYLRLNDAWNDLANNTGSVDVEIYHEEPAKIP